ncbi:MAG: hypothetical protein H6Q60_1155 [Oscillospiraceae bacterium]|nr:hypothetical protein [Oscillospiraceae bacterium]
MSVFSIDGVTYNVGVVEVTRKIDVLDKYAKRTESGVLSREILGIYHNYYMTFGDISDPDEYEALFDKLTEDEEYHTIVVPGTTGTFTYTAYISSVEDKLIKYTTDGNHRWGGLSASFIAKSPVSG